MTVYTPKTASWSWDITVLIAEYLLKLSITVFTALLPVLSFNIGHRYTITTTLFFGVLVAIEDDNNASWIEEQQPVLHRHIFLNICLSEFPQIPLKHMLIQNISYKKRHKPNYICYSINRIIWKFQTITG